MGQESVTSTGEGLVFLKGFPYFPTPSFVQPGQCVRIAIYSAVQPGWKKFTDRRDAIAMLNRNYLEDLRRGRNPMRSIVPRHDVRKTQPPPLQGRRLLLVGALFAIAI